MIKLDKEIDFITAEELLLEVHNRIPTYVEKNMVDDSIFYPIIRECLALLGSKIYPTDKQVIHVSKYIAELPVDFHKLILAMGCYNYTMVYTKDEYPHVTEEFIGTVGHKVNKPSVICMTDTEKEKYGYNGAYDFDIVQTFDLYSIRYNDFYPLAVSKKSHNFCTNGCFNKSEKCSTEIEIDRQNKRIITNFESGSIYIEYTQNLEKISPDGLDLLIPNFEQIKKWIKDACIVEAFTYMNWNYTDEFLERRKRDAKAELVISESNARSFVRRSEFKDLYDIRKLFFARYNKFNDMVYGDKYTNFNNSRFIERR